MKKLLTLVLALTLTLSLSVTAFAADTEIQPGSDGNPNPSTGDTKVTYTVAPAYTVTIPENVTLGNTAIVSIADASVAKGQKVVVKITATSGTANAFTVKSTEGAELTYTVTDDASTTYAIGDTVLEAAPTDTAKGSGSKELTFTAPTDVIYAGNYTGTVTFNVSVETN